MDKSHQVLIKGTSFEEELIELSFTGAGDVITTWSRNLGKASYILLWKDYDHQKWILYSPLGEESPNCRDLV